MGSRILRHSWFDSGYTLMLQFTDLSEIPSLRDSALVCSFPSVTHSGG